MASGLAGDCLRIIRGIRAPRPRMRARGLRWILRTRVPLQGITPSPSGGQTGILRGCIPMQTSPLLTTQVSGKEGGSIQASAGEV